MADVDVSVEAAGAVDASVEVAASEPAPEAEPAAAGPSVEMPWTADGVGEASKGELVTFLQANCSATFLSKHKLKGQAKAITKKAKAPALQAAYKEVLGDPSVLVSADTKVAEDEAAAKEKAAKEAAAAAAAAEKEGAAAAEAAAAASKGKEKKGFKKRTTSKAPSGAKTPKVGDNVQVMYKGTLEDGYLPRCHVYLAAHQHVSVAHCCSYCRTVFDQSQGWNAETRKKWKPLQFKVGQGRVIRGWVRRCTHSGTSLPLHCHVCPSFGASCLLGCMPASLSLARSRLHFETSLTVCHGALARRQDEALLTMSVGEEAVVTIQPDWAYGDKPPEGTKIPKGATLIFEIKLVSAG